VRQQLVVRELMLALTPPARLRGLLARPPLGREQGMLIRPCRAIHTWFMSFPIDVAFLDEAGLIVEQREQMGAFRMSPYVPQAAAVLELAAGRLEETGTELGDRLLFVPAEVAAASDSGARLR
jgi:hypothetical protein